MNKLLSLSINGMKPSEGFTVEAPSVFPTGGTDKISDIIANLLTIAIEIAAIIALFSFIYAGIQWTTSGGDEKKLETAKGRFKYSLIGLIVALSAFIIINFIKIWFRLIPA